MNVVHNIPPAPRKVREGTIPKPPDGPPVVWLKETAYVEIDKRCRNCGRGKLNEECWGCVYCFGVNHNPVQKGCNDWIPNTFVDKSRAAMAQWVERFFRKEDIKGSIPFGSSIFTLGSLLSVLTLLNVYLMGTRTLWGPITGVFFQIPWLLFAWKKDKGLMAGIIALAIIQAWNWYKWTLG